MKKNFVLIAAFIFIPFINVAIASDEEEVPYKEISAEQLLDLQRNDKSIVVIDSRGEKHFDGEVIKGAQHLSVKDTNFGTLSKILPSKEAGIVFYCSNTACNASALSAYKAAASGYKKLYKYPGGIEEWKTKGLPTIMIN